MSYQVLARKYRPKNFETLVGQEHVVRALTHALEQQRLHHAYLFTGTRGVGKTTLSRILAKSFNCEKGITAQACGVCDACSAIDAGRFVDYIEMDAASNRGVDEMASLLEQAIYAPSNARFKVYMIDEVHMLTNHAFNSMLKTLEEPPEHVKFILATTDPQKIPVTVLSRCLQFNLKQMPPGHIVGHLENILGQERIDFDVPALRLLAQGAHGSMRDALSLTDQAIAYAAGKVSLDAVQSMLGALDQSYLIRLLDALAQQDGAALLAVADDMSARSLSYKAALQDLGSMLHQIAIAQIAPAALAEDLPERVELLRLAQIFHKEEVQLFYQIAVHGRNEIGLAPDEYAGFSMTLLRMLAFRPASANISAASAGVGGSGVSPAVNRLAASPARPVISSTSVASINSAPSVATPKATSVTSSFVETSAAQVPGQGAELAPTPVLATPSGNTASQTPAVAETSIPINAVAPAKPMSPAMAALAAARAASGKQGANSASRPAPAALPASTTGAATVATGVSTTLVTSVAAAPPIAAPAGVSATPPVQVVNQAPVLTPIVQSKENESRSAYLDEAQMPPPWDDIDFEQQAMPPQTGRHKEIQEADYWPDDSSAELPLEPATPAVKALAPTVIGSEQEGVSTSAVMATSNAKVETEQESQASNLLENRTNASVVENLASVSKPLQLMPMSEISWDGHWPNLAASLPVRGVAQQLAQQSELRQCVLNGNAILFKLCVPLQTLLSAGSGEKLTAALNDRFGEFGREIRIDFEIGAVEQTANAQALAERAERQVQAEQAIQSDSFVQTLIREFGASILTGSVRPI
ncbi:DNA polymerase III subunit gamma/tau [Undibacterium flavidum]|uniref:DNA-directed DNA polymerase n=1 Tax=Undibacterium flavidum TaxID=2762297 RepID=A0ABR6Y6J2_9BURK|nr:DNA polymerase III subunit gamma/tau [Undibacterium flavidum]MBC3872240.1 DNA polymerase III subunit gamma/tau [Undibacterium flavidum]